MNEVIPFGPPPVPERGPNSPFAYVEYETDAGHTHMVMVGDGKYNAITEGASYEDLAIDLAEQVENCDEDRHDGHGRTHGTEEPKQAFAAALEQLLTKQYDNEWASREWRVKMYKKWGGHIPGMVLMPNESDSRKWEMMVPDHRGDPHFYEVPTGKLNDMVPDPQEVGAKPAEIGWKVDQRGGTGPVRRRQNRAQRRRR